MAVHQSHGMPVQRVQLVGGLVAALVLLALAILAVGALDDAGSSPTIYAGAASAWVLFVARARIQRNA